MFKTIQTKEVYKNKWTTVYDDEVEFEDGSKGKYGYIRRSNGVGALVLNQNQEVLLIKQFRYPIQEYQWNLPGGAIDENELPEKAIQREILEETGIKVKIKEKIGTFFPLSSASTEYDIIFLAQTSDVTSFLSNQFDESISTFQFFSIDEAIKMIDNGEITDASTANALQILQRRL